MIGPGSDAAVLRIKGSRKGLAVTVDCNSRYCLLDPYVGAVIATCEAARNLVVSGARPLGISDCLNFGNPEKPEVMWQFQQAIAGIRDACLALGVPVVSGNVSFYNDTEGRSIPPTPTIAMVGLLEDVTRCLAQGFRRAGDVIILIGRTREELGGSEYLATVHGLVRGSPPWIDLGSRSGCRHSYARSAEEGALALGARRRRGRARVALANAAPRPGRSARRARSISSRGCGPTCCSSGRASRA